MARSTAKDHGAKRRHILSVAATVFADGGIARTSMNEVAAACGISKANIYHYYDGKDALVFDILDSYLADLRDRVCGLETNTLEAGAALHVLTREILLAYEGMDSEHRIQTEGLPLLSGEQQRVLKGYQRDMVEVVRAVLARAVPDCDPARLRSVTMSVFGMLNWFFMWNPRATRGERVAYAATVADLTMGGVQGVA